MKGLVEIYEEQDKEFLKAFNEKHGIELYQRQSQIIEADPYEFMNPCDLWIIGKPADKECYDFLFKEIDKREKRAHNLALIYASIIVPFPLNIILSLLLFFKGKFR